MVWNAKARQPTTAILYNKDPLFGFIFIKHINKIIEEIPTVHRINIIHFQSIGFPLMK